MLRRAALLLMLLVAPLRALAGDPSSDAVRAEMLPGWRMADGSHMAGLRIVLADGWKTYWRAPGDAGIPPMFDWSGSRNLASAVVSWPRPVIFTQNGMRSIGYRNAVILPIHIRPQNPGRAVMLTGSIDIGICKNICVPRRLHVRVKLPRGNAQVVPEIAAALADRPFTAKEAGVSAVSCALAPGADGLRLTATVTMPSAGGKEAMVIETANPMIWVAEARTSRRGGVITAVTELMHVEGAPLLIDRSALRLTVLGSAHAVDIRGCPSG